MAQTRSAVPVIVGLIAAAGAIYWISSSGDPNLTCTDAEVLSEVRLIIAGLTPVGKQLEMIADPDWRPPQPPAQIGSNAYSPPPAPVVERPNLSELARLRENYVQIASSVAVSYDRDLSRVTCFATYRLNNQQIVDAASRSEGYEGPASLAGAQLLADTMMSIVRAPAPATATFTVQPGAKRGTLAINVRL